MRAQSIAAAAACVFVLAACTPITKAPAGPLSLGTTQATLSRDWSDITAVVPGKTNKVRVLSIDGPLLNRLYVTDGLAPGDALIKAAVKERPTPTIRAGMTTAERIEFIADSVSAMGYQRVETQRPKPARFADQSAVRVDLTARTPEGLEIKGVAQIAEVAGKTYAIVYLAPAEHYFAATLADAERVISSATVRQ